MTPEHLRDRLWPPPKPGVDWSKWIGSPVAWLALLLSAASLYATVVRTRDDLRVVINNIPFMSVSSKAQELSGLSQNLVFVNAGNRPVAVTKINLTVWFRPGNERPEPSCDEHGMKALLNYVFTPLVIKPGEMSLLALDTLEDGGAGAAASGFSGPTRAISYEVRDGRLTSFDLTPAPKNGDLMLACLRFHVILPDSESQQKEVLIGAAPMSNVSGSLYSETYMLMRNPVPQVLVSR
ncbi:hypothetical protein [Bradyrhizobium sp. SZCCHNR1051]|uniref:hypothetical protein n=1 Tax=Bradyrhizobium sp. SZCCHNR1051 TaxID=3057355 RepID=UPI002916D26E|nr:hypothetical protein [Bradyrhizobium sp. SZCCHNR1051]